MAFCMYSHQSDCLPEAIIIVNNSIYILRTESSLYWKSKKLCLSCAGENFLFSILDKLILFFEEKGFFAHTSEMTFYYDTPSG